METKKLILCEIELLRFFASVSVVLYHVYYVYLIYVPLNFKYFEYAFMGVQTFFLISGFVMSLPDVSNENPFTFLKKRIRRIFPAYLIVTFVILPFYYIKTKTGFFDNILSSLLLFPHWDKINSNFNPILGVGWTLQFELIFYYVIFAFMLSKCKSPVIVSGIFLALVSLFVHLFGESQLITYALNPYIYSYFLLGSFICKIRNFDSGRLIIKIIFLVSLITLAFSFVEGANEGNLAVQFALPVSLFLFPFIFRFYFVYKNIIILFIASISYELYLVHHPVLSLLGKLTQGKLSFMPFLIIGFALSLSAAYVLNRGVFYGFCKAKELYKTK